MTQAQTAHRTNWPLVSVCIPSYNQEAYIGQAIESVLAQSYANFECLVVDDASLDSTFEVAQRYGDPRIKVARNPSNLGIEGNWNRVVENAQGKYIKVLCGDDVIYPRCLERQVLALEQAKHANAALACCARDVITPHSVRILTRRTVSHDKLITGLDAIRKNIRSGSNLIGEPSGILMRAELLRKVGRFDGAVPYLIDLDMWVRMLLHGDLVMLAEPLFAFRISQTALSFTLANRQSREYCAFIDRMRRVRHIKDIRPHDALVGKLMSYVKMFARRVFYLFFLSKYLSRAAPKGAVLPLKGHRP